MNTINEMPLIWLVIAAVIIGQLIRVVIHFAFNFNWSNVWSKSKMYKGFLCKSKDHYFLDKLDKLRSENIHIPQYPPKIPFGDRPEIMKDKTPEHYPSIDDSMHLIKWIRDNCTLSSVVGFNEKFYTYKDEVITKEKLFSEYIKSITL